jgi:hypothetical protein
MFSTRSSARLLVMSLGCLVASCGDPPHPPGDGGMPDGSTPVIVGTGTAGDPIVLQERVRVPSPVATQAGQIVWYRVDLVGDGPFVLLTENVPYSISLDIRAAPDWLSPSLGDCDGGPGAVVCSLALAPGRYYVSGTYVPILASTPYHLTYFELDPEGTTSAPVVLEPNAPARWSAVTSDAPSYYEFVASVSGAYKVRLDTAGGYTAATQIDVFANADFTSTPIESCFYTSSNDGCALSGLLAGTYGIRASPASAGSYSLLQARVVFGLGRGAPGDYVAISGGTHQGGVDSWSQSYYSFTTGSGPAGSYVFTFASPSEGHHVRLYAADSSSAYALGECQKQSAPCEIGGLDSNATYYLIVYGSYGIDETFTLTYAKGSFEGSENQPAALALGTPHDVPMGTAVYSHFRFTTTSSGPYEIEVAPLAPGSTYMPFFSIFEDEALTIYAGNCNAIPCVSDSLDANREYYFELASSSSTILRVTVSRAAAGEGSVAEPVPLALGDAHTTLFSGTNGSYYSYATGASPPARIAILARTSLGGYWPTSISPMPTYDCQDPVCIYSGLLPNTTYRFSYDYFSDDIAGVVRIIDMSGAPTCDAHASTCLDFEAGAPVTTEPAYSVDNWSLASGTAANGTQSFLCGNQVNNNEETCFTYAAPGVTSTVLFNLREVTDVASGLRVVTQDGAYESYVDAPLVNGQWRRGLVFAPPLANRSWTFCYRKNGTGGGLDTAWIDDIQFE